MPLLVPLTMKLVRSSSFIVEPPTVEGSPEVAGVPSVVGTPCSEGSFSFDFDSPVVEMSISKGKDEEYVPDTPDMRNIGEAIVVVLHRF